MPDVFATAAARATASGQPKEFVIHSLRYSMLTRLGESGADAFTIMRIAGYSSARVSQRYVHPTPEGMVRAFERLQEFNAVRYEEAGAEAKAEAVGGSDVPKESPKVKNDRKPKSLQIVEFKTSGA